MGQVGRIILCILIEKWNASWKCWLINYLNLGNKIQELPSCPKPDFSDIGGRKMRISSVQFTSVAQSCPTLCDPMDYSTPGLPVHHQLPEFTQTQVHSVHDAIQPSHPLSSPSPPALNLSQNQSVLWIRWPKYWSFSFSISPSNEYSGLISVRIVWFDLLESKGLSRVFSNTTAQKHQFFSAQLSLQSTSHIYTWLLEKPKLWLYTPLLANEGLCFLICCLGVS